MRAKLHPIKKSEYARPMFSHAEALEITGLTADTLLTWHKRGYLPHMGTREQAGRGFRRKYSTIDVIYLVLLKHMVGRVPMAHACLGAAQSIRGVISIFEMARYAETVEELQGLPDFTIIGFEDLDEKFQFEVFSDRPDAGAPMCPGGGIQSWMRIALVQSALVLSLTNIALAVFTRIQEVMERQKARRDQK